jgi:hypothetical protein
MWWKWKSYKNLKKNKLDTITVLIYNSRAGNRPTKRVTVKGYYNYGIMREVWHLKKKQMLVMGVQLLGKVIYIN